MDVQVIGLFNSGTNLVSKIIKELFDCKIDKEGNTIFWKHSLITKEFLNQQLKSQNRQTQNYYTIFVVVIKHLDLWIESMKKKGANYGLISKDDKIELSPPLHLLNRIHYSLPKSNIEFKSLEDCWNKFYDNAINLIPNNRSIIVRYEDVILQPRKLVSNLNRKLNLKSRFNLNRGLIGKSLENIFRSPSKRTGNPRYGKDAKEYYREKIKDCKNTNIISQKLLKIYD